MPDERQRAIAELSRSLAPRLSRSHQGLASEVTRAGSRRIPLQGRFRSVQVAVATGDGATKTHCVTSQAELDALLDQVQP